MGICVFASRYLPLAELLLLEWVGVLAPVIEVAEKPHLLKK